MRTLCTGLSVLVLALAGCGGDDEGGGSADTGTATEEQQTATENSGDAQAAAGKEVFTSNCGGCHTLSDAGTNGQQGPNLDELKPDQATLQRQVTNGGGAMPAFKDRLSAKEIESVAAYVSSVAGG
jgi:mono/diheme cytochrome c family protein